MVAPKNSSKSLKEKSDDKKSTSPSPEPFQEPDGMTTIDLNKSDDFSKESEVDEAKLKKQAQIKYLAQLLFALGSIFLTVILFIMIAFLNKEYHLFTVMPFLKSNQSSPLSEYTHIPSPSEEFLNLTRILNQDKFREKLKSGQYIQQFPLEMDLCRHIKSVEFCCEIFRHSDLDQLTEFCNVNDMLNYLMEYEMNKERELKYNKYDTYNEENIYVHDRSSKNTPQDYKNPLQSKFPPNKFKIYQHNQIVDDLPQFKKSHYGDFPSELPAHLKQPKSSSERSKIFDKEESFNKINKSLQKNILNSKYESKRLDMSTDQSASWVKNIRTKRQNDFGRYHQVHVFPYRRLKPGEPRLYHQDYHDFNQYHLPEKQDQYLQTHHFTKQKGNSRNEQGNNQIVLPDNVQHFNTPSTLERPENFNFQNNHPHNELLSSVNEGSSHNTDQFFEQDNFRTLNFQNSDLNLNEKFHTENQGDDKIAPALQSYWIPLPEHVREEIRHHVTNAPKVEHLYRLSDFQQKVEPGFHNHYVDGDRQGNNNFEEFGSEDPGRLSQIDRGPNMEFLKEIELKADANGKFHIDNRQMAKEHTLNRSYGGEDTNTTEGSKLSFNLATDSLNEDFIAKSSQMPSVIDDITTQNTKDLEQILASTHNYHKYNSNKIIYTDSKNTFTTNNRKVYLARPPEITSEYKYLNSQGRDGSTLLGSINNEKGTAKFQVINAKSKNDDVFVDRKENNYVEFSTTSTQNINNDIFSDQSQQSTIKLYTPHSQMQTNNNNNTESKASISKGISDNISKIDKLNNNTTSISKEQIKNNTLFEETTTNINDNIFDAHGQNHNKELYKSKSSETKINNTDSKATTIKSVLDGTHDVESQTNTKQLYSTKGSKMEINNNADSEVITVKNVPTKHQYNTTNIYKHNSIQEQIKDNIESKETPGTGETDVFDIKNQYNNTKLYTTNNNGEEIKNIADSVITTFRNMLDNISDVKSQQNITRYHADNKEQIKNNTALGTTSIIDDISDTKNHKNDTEFYTIHSNKEQIKNKTDFKSTLVKNDVPDVKGQQNTREFNTVNSKIAHVKNNTTTYVNSKMGKNYDILDAKNLHSNPKFYTPVINNHQINNDARSEATTIESVLNGLPDAKDQQNITEYYITNNSTENNKNNATPESTTIKSKNDDVLIAKNVKVNNTRERLLFNYANIEQSTLKISADIDGGSDNVATDLQVSTDNNMENSDGKHTYKAAENGENNDNSSEMQLINSTPENFIAFKGISRSNGAQDEFRPKSKQDSFTASEVIQSNQQTYINPCFNPYLSPYMSPYIPYMPPAKLGSAQDPGFLKIVSVSQPHVQNQPMYVLNPPMVYGVPQITNPTYSTLSQNTFLPQGYFSQVAQSPYGGNNNNPVPVAGAGGQYYMCNPIPTPTNNIAGIPGVDVRRGRDATNLQGLLEGLDDFSTNNKSREATLICPLGEQACLDNGKCIKNHHVCDSEVHCEDSSDEIACTCKERVGKLRLCDGYCDCPICEDEQGCFGCEEDEFSCDDWSRFRRSTCIPIIQRCDGTKQCEITGKDEIDCSMLADHIGNFPLNKISNAVGFLHRNYKGKWYPTCFGTELWAAQVCQVEAGPSAIIPKAHMTLTTDPYNGLFINILPNNEISLVNSCVQDRAAFVECPPIYCGLRFLVNNPYRMHEVDTSVENMLNDLERAYKLKENGLSRSDMDSIIDVGRINTVFDTSDDDLNFISKKRRDINFTNLRNKIQLTHEHLEEVIENLERTLRRREISKDDRISETLKESRIVGGNPSQPAAWPWLVSIYKNGIFHCGGVLINELWVVTASHCVDRYWQYFYEIQAGALRRFSYSPMDQRRWAKLVVSNEFYSKSNLRNDIALMKLSAPVRYNKYVRPICLPSESTAGQDFLKGPSPGTICTTVGWGATVEHGTDPDHMREVEVPILQHCRHKEDSDTDEICAGLTEGGRDACQGDSGGPLMCRNPNNPNQWYLAGIVSHGEGCARPNEPGVYTKVSRYMGWIAENIIDDKFTITMPLQTCPGFVCKGTKRCIPKKRRCDRIIDCLLGDDEINCEDHFREIFKHTRKSSTGNLPADIVHNIVPPQEFGIVGSKLNRTMEVKDEESSSATVKNEIEENIYMISRISEDDRETKQKRTFEDTYFKCSAMLQVIPVNKRCNKVIDCEDGTDEFNCTCADYIKNIDPSAICDGISDCYDLSDEKECIACNKTEYTCRLAQKCIDISKRCDGTADCPQNEDEMNCVSLTDGLTLNLDRDDRPMFKSRGIVTVNHLGIWKPLCLNSSSQLVNEEPSIATIICNLLGFDEYFSYHRYMIEDSNINVSYDLRNGRILSKQEANECNDCCNGLYISCSNISISTTLYYKSLEHVKELYFSPWTAAIYSSGQYKCMGTLLNEYWIVTSSKCFRGITPLQGKYLAAVLGKGKINLPVKGPHEQVIRIVESITVDQTDILLLRLDEKVKFNRYVQAANLELRRESPQKEKCYAVGQDSENKVKFLSLSPIKNCLVGFRCFEKKIEEHCKDIYSWSGTIICNSRNGWYPAAIFNEEPGHCGFNPGKKYTSIRFYKNQIARAMAQNIDPISPPFCNGLQCSLGNCIPKEKICDGVLDCEDGEDEKNSICYEKEKECHTTDNCVCPQTHLKCPITNKCFPKSSFCDRINNCGEFEDEPEVCSCRNYLKLTNPAKICDGILHCMDRSDEDPDICSCKLEDFQCGKLNKCVPQDMVCDGIKDCPNGEDEKTCLSLNAENRYRINAGEVITRTAGVWHAGCFDLNYSTLQLEEICSKLGFTGGSAHQLTAPHNLTTLTTLRPVLDLFDVIWLRRLSGNKLKLRMRTGHDQYVKFVPDKRCHRLFIACI